MLDLEFKLKLSKHYLILMLTIFLVSIDIVFMLPIPLWIKVLASLLVAIYGVSVIWQYVLLRSRNSIISIRRQSDGTWLLQTNRNKYTADLCGDSTVTALISILRFREPKNFWRRTAIIFRDSLGVEQYRKLLVALKMDSPAVGSETPPPSF